MSSLIKELLETLYIKECGFIKTLIFAEFTRFFLIFHNANFH